ncbi:MAG TPA: IS4 family transposase [Lacipirellulaceae bacterium]|nr:IS4 family transposase [Lacipirellulaceae bacterium]
MSHSPREPIREEDVQGLKYFRKLWPLFERLHEVGCQRDKAGNRALFMDQYCSLVLLFLFNPCVRSLRALQQASELKNVQRKLGCSRSSLGSLSEATDVFDPERLRQIIGELAAEVKPSRDRSDDLVQHVVTAVDGSVVETLSTIAEAAYLKTKNGDSRSAWRLHTHFEVDRGVPTRIDVTSGKNSGKNDEKNVLRAHLEADHCYLMDRWYAQFTLFNEIHSLGSSYVCRVRDNSRYEVVQERPLSEAARAAGVLQDAVVTLGATSPAAARPDHPIRLVLVACTPHQKTGGRKGGTAGPPSDGVLRIATNLLDPPAEIVAELYRQRWTIEIFFRFFKHVLGCRHLLSTARAGIEIQTYMAIIACLLLALWTSGKPTLRTYEMVCLYLQGWADEEELLAHLKKLKPSAA